MAEEEVKPEVEEVKPQVKPEAVESPKEKKKKRRKAWGNKTIRKEKRIASLDAENKAKFEEVVKIIQSGESFSQASSATGIPSSDLKEKCIEKGIVSPFYSPKQKERAEKNKK